MGGGGLRNPPSTLPSALPSSVPSISNCKPSSGPLSSLPSSLPSSGPLSSNFKPSSVPSSRRSAGSFQAPAVGAGSNIVSAESTGLRMSSTPSLRSFFAAEHHTHIARSEPPQSWNYSTEQDGD